LSNEVQPRCYCEWCVDLNYCSLVAATLLYVGRKQFLRLLRPEQCSVIKKTFQLIRLELKKKGVVRSREEGVVACNDWADKL
jgi:hypothetical protein